MNEKDLSASFARFRRVARVLRQSVFRSSYLWVGDFWHLGVISVNPDGESVGRGAGGFILSRYDASFFVLKPAIVKRGSSADTFDLATGDRLFVASLYSLKDGRQFNRGGAGVRRVKGYGTLFADSASFGPGGVIAGCFFSVGIPDTLECRSGLRCIVGGRSWMPSRGALSYDAGGVSELFQAGSLADGAGGMVADD